MAFQAIANAAKAKAAAPATPEAEERYRRIVAAMQARQGGGAPQMPQAPPTPPIAPAATAPPPGARPQSPNVRQTAHDREEAARLAASRQGGALSGLFEDGNSLLRAVVASEVLAPPLGLRENPNWLIRRPPNEPST